MSEKEAARVLDELEHKDPEAAKEFLELLEEVRARNPVRDNLHHMTANAVSSRETLYNPNEDFHG